MPIADRMIRRVADFAVIKDMFEEGRRLKAEFGADNVYDFSLGNPDVPPPELVPQGAAGTGGLTLSRIRADDRASAGARGAGPPPPASTASRSRRT